MRTWAAEKLGGGLRPAAGPSANASHGADVVVLREVSKSFGETQALRSCSFTARAGEVHAIVGENGSGKSTMAKLLAGVLHPDAGSVAVLDARPISPQAAKKTGIAVVFQEILVAESGTVLDNLFIGHDGLFQASLSQRQKRLRSQALMDSLVGSPVDLDAVVDELPLNTRQWIVIARALLMEPRVIVFDESTAALDHSSVGRFFSVLGQLRNSGVCVLIVTHRIHELTTICDRATVLSDGVDVGTLSGGEITEFRLLELMRRSGRPHAHSSPERPQPASTFRTKEVLAVKGLRLTAQSAPMDFTLRSGEIVGLAGLEGHGQAEFIQTVTGFRKPVAGEVTARSDGRGKIIDSARAADQAGVAYIPGDRKSEGLFANLSIFENFGISRYRATARAGFIDIGRIKSMFQEQVQDLSIRLGRAGDPINSLSGGNQQKVVIARSLAAQPLIIALNDPTRGVDIGAKHDLYALLRKLAGEGKAILFLSNEIEEFVGLCDRVVVFRMQSDFSTLYADQISTDAILAAMFGYNNAEGLENAP